MKFRPISAVIFDFDETLVDSFESRFSGIRQAVERHLGRDFSKPEALDLVRRFSNIEALARYLSSDRVVAHDIAETYREYIYGEGRKDLRPFPGIRGALSRLSKRMPLALVTSRYRDISHGEDNWGVIHDLAALRLSRYFCVVVGYEDTDEHKPSPAPFLRCLDVLGLRGAILAVGDSPLDIRAARGAGIHAAGALWGAVDPQGVLAEEPDISFERPRDLLPFVLQPVR